VPLNPRNRRPLRVLAALFVIVAGLYGLLASVHTWGEAQLTPKLGLDLEGGTQLILEPKVVGNRAINQGQIDKAVDIIRQRVDGSGVAEAEVATQGGRNIVISLPGKPPQSTVDSLSKSSQLRFRPVLVEAPNAAPAPAPSVTPSGGGSATPPGKATATPSGKATATPSAKATTPAKATAKPSSPASTSAGSGFPEALRAPAAATPSPSATAPAKAAASTKATTPTKATPAATATSAPAPTPTAPVPAPTAPATDAAKGTASDLAQITPAIEKQFTSLDCTKPAQVQAIVDDPDKVMVTCSVEGTSKYILGPAEVEGQDVKDAASGAELNQQGAPTGGYEIRLSFNGKGTKEFGDVTSRLVGLQPPQNQFAIVLDNQVISAPQTNSAITNGSASITGSFTAESARLLADQIKFGALPLSFSLQTQDDISPQLGSDQLQKGLIAGAIGLLLVVLYSLVQYRALGLVTVASLLVASVLTYAAVTLLGWSHGFRLTMAGVTGLIVSIGITADSFIVYFERVRDEVREGRPLRTAVETGWKRARRTILIADAVNLLAAAVLYALAASNVRGFAFTLMLTTVIDIVVVMLFTHPLVAILANTKFFGEGHKWSGFDPEHLGTTLPRYAGRGRVTIAAQRAAAEGGHAS
jgi:preprotein translocase subunit SecD